MKDSTAFVSLLYYCLVSLFFIYYLTPVFAAFILKTKNLQGDTEMEYEDSIKNYIKPSKILTAAVYIIPVLIAAFLVLWFAILVTDTPQEPTELDSVNSSADDYSYINAVGVSDWLYDYDGSVYYAVESSDSEFYIARLEKSDIDSMGNLRDYWDSELGSVETPEPRKLSGLVRKITFPFANDLADVLGLTKQEFDDYFGYRYLDATTSPTEDSAMVCLVIALFALIIWSLPLICFVSIRRNMKRSIAVLSSRSQLAAAAHELDSPLNVHIGKNLCMTRNYVFCKNSGFAAAYTDIKWVFKRVQKYNFIPIGAYIVVNTPQISNVNIANVKASNKEELSGQIMERIANNNPDVMLGYSAEYSKAYREICKAANAKRQSGE